jgi:hypothetical protein
VCRELYQKSLIDEISYGIVDGAWGPWRNIARLGGGLRARLDQRGGLAGRPVPDRDVMACIEQAPRHGKSHHPESEITELFRVPPTRFANSG